MVSDWLASSKLESWLQTLLLGHYQDSLKLRLDRREELEDIHESPNSPMAKLLVDRRPHRLPGHRGHWRAPWRLMAQHRIEQLPEVPTRKALPKGSAPCHVPEEGCCPTEQLWKVRGLPSQQGTGSLGGQLPNLGSSRPSSFFPGADLGQNPRVSLSSEDQNRGEFLPSVLQQWTAGECLPRRFSGRSQSLGEFLPLGKPVSPWASFSPRRLQDEFLPEFHSFSSVHHTGRVSPWAAFFSGRLLFNGGSGLRNGIFSGESIRPLAVCVCVSPSVPKSRN